MKRYAPRRAAERWSKPRYGCGAGIGAGVGGLIGTWCACSLTLMSFDVAADMVLLASVPQVSVASTLSRKP